MNLAFLHSERFWKLFLVGLIAGLNVPLPHNLWLMGATVAIGIWFGGSVIVGTVDRASERIGGKAVSPQ